jgi:hypothetical protein
MLISVKNIDYIVVIIRLWAMSVWHLNTPLPVKVDSILSFKEIIF